MRRKKSAPYFHYGSAKGTWKMGAGLILAALGGIGAAIALSLAAGRWLPSLGELALYLVVLALGIVGAAVCSRAGHLCWAFFLVLLSVFVARSLTITVRADILAHATLTGGGSRVLLIALGVILTAGIGVGLLFASGRDHWAFIVVISAIAVFPTLINCMDAINVAADTKVSHAATVEVTQTGTKEGYALLGKGSASVKMNVHYVVAAENDTVPAGTEIKISEELYSALRPGDRIRILLHPGAIGAPWVEVVPGNG